MDPVEKRLQLGQVPVPVDPVSAESDFGGQAIVKHHDFGEGKFPNPRQILHVMSDHQIQIASVQGFPGLLQGPEFHIPRQRTHVFIPVADFARRDFRFHHPEPVTDAGQQA